MEKERNMEIVRMLVCFGGGWETSVDGRYAYKGGKVKGIRIVKETMYQDFVRELYGKIEVDENEYDLKLEVLWGSSSIPLPPMEISNDVDLQFFFGGAVTSDNLYVPLCITLVPKILKQSPLQQISNCHTHCGSGSGSNQVSPTMPTLNEPELETLPTSVPVKTFEEQLPMSLLEMPPSQISPPVLSLPPNNDDAVHVHLDTQDHPNHDDGNATNIVNTYMKCDVEDYLEGAMGNHMRDDTLVKDDALVKDNAPVDNENGLNPNVLNAGSSRRVFHYLPSCIDSSIMPKDDTAPMDNNASLSAGQIFPSKKELRKRLSLHAISNHYQFKVSRSSMARFEAVCVNESCKWRARAIKSPGTENFELRRLDRHHSCETDQKSVGHRQASSWVISEHIRNLMQEKQCQYKPKQIRDDILTKYGIELSYNKCWRAREFAIREIRGSAENSPALSPSTRDNVRRKKCGSRGTVHRKSVSSDTVQRKCGRCGTYGHNKQTCETDMQESNPSPTLLKNESQT